MRKGQAEEVGGIHEKTNLELILLGNLKISSQVWRRAEKCRGPGPKLSEKGEGILHHRG